MKRLLNIAHGTVYSGIMLLNYGLGNMGISSEYWEIHEKVLLALFVLTVILQAVIIIKVRNRFLIACALQILSFLFVICLYGQSYSFMDSDLTEGKVWIRSGSYLVAEIGIIAAAAFLWGKFRRAVIEQHTED